MGIFPDLKTDSMKDCFLIVFDYSSPIDVDEEIPLGVDGNLSPIRFPATAAASLSILSVSSLDTPSDSKLPSNEPDIDSFRIPNRDSNSRLTSGMILPK